MAESLDSIWREWALRNRRSHQRLSLARERGTEISRNIVALVRILAGLIGLVIGFGAFTATDPLGDGTLMLIGGYLLFAIALLLASLISWEAHARLTRLAPAVDWAICLTVLIVGPANTALYLPFVLFLLIVSLNRSRWSGVLFAYLLLLATIAAHNWLAAIAPIIARADQATLLLQAALTSFTALSVIAARLDQPNRYLLRQWSQELLDVTASARALPIDIIAERLGTLFETSDLLFCWTAESAGGVQCVRFRNGAVERHEPNPDTARSLLEPGAGDRCFLWDGRTRNALVEHSHPMRSLVVPIAASPLPAAWAPGLRRFAALPVRAGEIRGYIYLIDIPRISETMLARAGRAAEAVSNTLNRYQLFAAWRDRAFANARFELSRDMHDSVLQTLAGLRMRIASLIKQDGTLSPGDRREHLDDVQSVISAEQACLRDMMTDTGQSAGEKIDLTAHLAQRVELLSRQWAIGCRLATDDDHIWVASDAAIEVEFLVREAVSNAVQHARATDIAVTVALREGSLFIALRTNGKPSRAVSRALQANPDGIASRSLLRRVAALQGTAYAEDIDSGDLLAMRIPMEFDGNGQAADR
jgi:signal transduction histidine kinase